MSDSEKKKVIIDLTNVRLETERLVLRPWQESDLEDFYAYASVPGVGEMAGWPHHQSMEDSKQILERFISGRHVFALECKENGKVIGSLGLHHSWANEKNHYPEKRIVEIGYVLSKDYWGRGLMPEAVKKTIPFFFDYFDLAALTICHYTKNHQSRRVIEKCGFTFAQTDRQYVDFCDEDWEEMQYILWREDVK